MSSGGVNLTIYYIITIQIFHYIYFLRGACHAPVNVKPLVYTHLGNKMQYYWFKLRMYWIDKTYNEHPYVPTKCVPYIKNAYRTYMYFMMHFLGLYDMGLICSILSAKYCDLYTSLRIRVIFVLAFIYSFVS